MSVSVKNITPHCWLAGVMQVDLETPEGEREGFAVHIENEGRKALQQGQKVLKEAGVWMGDLQTVIASGPSGLLMVTSSSGWVTRLGEAYRYALERNLWRASAAPRGAGGLRIYSDSSRKSIRQ